MNISDTRPGEGLQTLVPVEAWIALLDHASEIITRRVDGRRPERVTRYEATLIELAAGAFDRKRSVDFIRLVRFGASMIERHRSIERRRALDSADLRELAASFRRNSRVNWKATLARWAERQISGGDPADL